MQQQNIIEIRQNDIDQANIAFRDFMQLTENEFNLRAKQTKGLYQNCSGLELEKYTVNILKEVSAATPFRSDNIHLVSGAKFPDIISEKHYGIEVGFFQLVKYLAQFFLLASDAVGIGSLIPRPVHTAKSGYPGGTDFVFGLGIGIYRSNQQKQKD